MTETKTKARTTAEKRRARKKRRSITLPGGEVADAPVYQGQRTPPEDPRKIALQARSRVWGLPEGAVNPRYPLHGPLSGSAAGLCIQSILPEREQGAIWQIWQDICAAQRAYRMRILGTTGEPQTGTLAVPPEPFETDDRHSIDIRTAAERDRDAKRAWARWQSAIAALPAPQMIWAIKGALDGGINGQGGDMWRDGQPTQRGRGFVQALVVLGKETS